MVTGPEQQHDELIGTLAAGRYRIQSPLGEGGMGRVYLAVHEAIEKTVAIKVLRSEYSNKKDIVTRFQQEAISASRIKHPNVLDVFDFGKLDNGCFFLAMEYLEGSDLADELVRCRVIDPVRGVHIGWQICRALASAHERGVVHRDLKPENVFLQRTPDGDEVVKIVDFGIAQLRTNEEAAANEPKRRRLTRTGMIFGTPEYMSPEQAAGKQADLRVDVYALGIILYEMFTGAVPFTGESFMAVLAAHLNDPPAEMRSFYPQLAISPEFESLIMRMLVKDPNGRFQSMSEVANLLAATREGRMDGLGAQRGSIPDISTVNFVPSQPPPAAAGAGQAGPVSRRVTPGANTAVIGAPEAAGYAPSPAGYAPATSGSAAALTMPQTDGDVARAQTQLGAEAVTRPPTRSSLGLLVVAAGLLLTIVAAGAVGIVVFLQTRDQTPAVEAPTASLAPVPSVAAVAPEPVPSASASAGPTEVTPTSTVRLDVHTVPPGAVLFKDGAQVCDQTPCEVMATPNETLELEARKGAAKGKVKVLAQKEQKVTIPLSGQTARPPRPAATGGPKLCERFDPNLGIKIMAPCR